MSLDSLSLKKEGQHHHSWPKEECSQEHDIFGSVEVMSRYLNKCRECESDDGSVEVMSGE